MFYLVTAVIFLASNLPGLNLLYLAFTLVGFIYWTCKKNDELTLLLLILGSSFAYTSSSIWNNGLIPALAFLLLGLSSLKIRGRVKTSGVLITAFCIIGLFALSVGNVFEVGIHPVIVDLLVVASIPLAALRFRGLSEHQFFQALSVCSLITLIKIVIFAFVGIENPVLSTYTEERFLDTLDELTGFYLLFVLVLMSAPNRLRWVTIGLFSILIFHYITTDNWLGYYGIGSQVLLVLILFITFLLIRFPIGLGAIIGVQAFLIPMLSLSPDNMGDLKLQQLFSALDILSGSDIALLSHSVHVRLAEIITFLDGPWWHQLFGGGLGGYINLSDHFPNYLGPDDFSEQQINSGKISTPHNLGYLLVKLGYIGLSLALVFFVWIYRLTRQMSALKFSLYMTSAIFLVLNFGYTLKISFLLGVLWVVISDCYQRENAGMQKLDFNEGVSRRCI